MNKHEGSDVTWAGPILEAERLLKAAGDLLEGRQWDEALELLVKQQQAVARVAQWVLREVA